MNIYSDGMSNYSPSGSFSFQCKIVLWKFPFDSHRCAVKMESFRFSQRHVILEPGEFALQNFQESEEWRTEIDEIKVIGTKYRNVTYYSIEFRLIFTRKSQYYIFAIVLPCLVAVGVEMSTFSIPINQFVRLQLSFMTLLSFSVLQGVFQVQLPHSSDYPPLLFLYICCTITLIGFVILFQALAIYFANIDNATTQSNKRRQSIIKHSWQLAYFCNNVAFYTFSTFLFIISPVFLIGFLPFQNIIS